jgi:hypothetical protein
MTFVAIHGNDRIGEMYKKYTMYRYIKSYHVVSISWTSVLNICPLEQPVEDSLQGL